MQVCFTCGAPNPPDAAQCEACGADLPMGQAAAQAAAPPLETPMPTAEDSRCPFCNGLVEPDATECPHCKLNLDARSPLNAPAPRGHVDNLTGRYEEFQSKVEGLRTGACKPEAFLEWLSKIRIVLADKRETYIRTVREMGYYDTRPDEVEVATNAILDFEDAVEDMWAFTLGQTDVSGLDNALAKMWEANERINVAMRMNRDFRAGLEDDWGFM